MALRNTITTTLLIGFSPLVAASASLVSCTGDEFEGCQASRTCPPATGGAGGEAGAIGDSGGSGGSDAAGASSSGSSDGPTSGGSSSRGAGGGASASASSAGGSGGSDGDASVGGSGGEGGADGSNTGGSGGTDMGYDGPTLGGSCDEPGALACNGAAQKLRLICEDGEWQNNGSCAAEENCEQSSGVCAPIDESCDDLEPGDRYCDEDTVRECGEDFVNSRAIEECTAACRVFEGQAQCVRVTQVAAGRHTCAVLSTGQLKCWGANTAGELGLGHTNTIGDEPSEMPPPDVPLDEPVKHVAVGITVTGGNHTCAVLQSGAVRCWGQNQTGQLGLGHTQPIGNEELPTEDIELGVPATQVALGQTHSCALLETGDVRCWGNAALLGFGATEHVGDNEAPTENVALGGKAVQIAAGSTHTCALLDTGAVRCWGANYWGEIGVPPGTDLTDQPVSPDINLGGPASYVGLGDEMSCAVVILGTSETGSVRCWGDGRLGRLGRGNEDPVGAAGTMPPASVNLGSIGTNAVQVNASSQHSCALMTSGAVRCWGYGAAGGYATTDRFGDDPDELPTPDVALSGQAVAISLSDNGYTCAILEDGNLQCWGYNNLGSLGLGHTDYIGDTETPDEAGLVLVF